jgi:transposase
MTTKFSEDVVKKIMSLSYYVTRDGMSFGRFCRELNTNFDVEISDVTLSKILKENGIYPTHHRKISNEVAEKVVALRKTSCGRTLTLTEFLKMLERDHGIKISHGSLYNIFRARGVESLLRQGKQLGFIV